MFLSGCYVNRTVGRESFHSFLIISVGQALISPDYCFFCFLFFLREVTHVCVRGKHKFAHIETASLKQFLKS